MSQALEAIKAASARAGELTGQIRLTVPALAVPFVINPVLPRFVALHPKVEVEVQVDNRLHRHRGGGLRRRRSAWRNFSSATWCTCA